MRSKHDDRQRAGPSQPRRRGTRHEAAFLGTISAWSKRVFSMVDTDNHYLSRVLAESVQHSVATPTGRPDAVRAAGLIELTCRPADLSTQRADRVCDNEGVGRGVGENQFQLRLARMGLRRRTLGSTCLTATR